MVNLCLVHFQLLNECVTEVPAMFHSLVQLTETPAAACEERLLTRAELLPDLFEAVMRGLLAMHGPS
jgi:hypothetical protein